MNKSITISVHELAMRNAQGKIDLIDVRTPTEFREVRAAPARNVPLDELKPHDALQSREDAPKQTLYVICKGGARGETAQQIFASAGFANVINIEGGTEAWIAAGLPIVRGN